MIERLSNLGIAIKVFVAPVLLTVSMALLAVIFSIGMTRQSDAVSELYHNSFQRSSYIASLENQSTSIEANLYRLLSWQRAGVGAGKLSELDKQVRNDLATLQEGFADFRAGVKAAGDEVAVAEAVAGPMKEFITTAKDVLDMYAVDPTTALVMMTNTEQQYDALGAAVVNYEEFASTRTVTVYEGSVSLAKSAKLQYFAVFAAFMAIGSGVTVLLARLIARPVVQITGVMGRLADGDTAVEIPSLANRDEIGAMARAVAVFRDSMRKAAALEDEQRRQQGRQAAVFARRNDLIDRFNTAMDSILSVVVGAVDKVQEMSGSLRTTAGRASEQGAAVAVAAQQSSTNVEAVAAATEQLGASVQEISRQVADTATITGQAVTGIQAATSTIAGMDDAARRIGEIVGLIHDIAGQTNLLALNATIEAARAGEAGKGFAVVAGEVKNLANQTAKATEEITQQVQAVQDVSAHAVGAIREVAGTIDRVNAVVASIAAAVEEQSAATGEIVRSIQQAATGNAQVTHNIGEVSDAADITGTMATSMCDAATTLTGEVGHLRQEISEFLAGVAAEAA